MGWSVLIDNDADEIERQGRIRRDGRNRLQDSEQNQSLSIPPPDSKKREFAFSEILRIPAPDDEFALLTMAEL